MERHTIVAVVFGYGSSWVSKFLKERAAAVNDRVECIARLDAVKVRGEADGFSQCASVPRKANRRAWTNLTTLRKKLTITSLPHSTAWLVVTMS